jgi:hypothetical protein
MLWRTVRTTQRYFTANRIASNSRSMSGITQQLADIAIAAKDTVVAAVAPEQPEQPEQPQQAENISEGGNNLATKSGGELVELATS